MTFAYDYRHSQPVIVCGGFTAPAINVLEEQAEDDANEEEDPLEYLD